MTVYNGGNFLKPAVKSVLDQTYKDFEFLIINDCSKDDSLAVIESFHDARIRVLNNKENLGQTRSLNLGFQLAKSEYVARIDADDMAFPHWLQSQVNFLQKHGESDVLSAGLVTFHEKGLGKVYWSPFSREDMLLRAIINSPINHGGAFMKRETILRCGGYNNNYKIAADYGVWVSLLRENARIMSNSDIVMAIRRHAESASEKNKLTQALQEVSDIVRKHINFISTAELTPQESLLMCRAHYDEGGLNDENFRRAVKIHKKVYAGLRDDLGLDKKRVQFWYIKQARTFFLRRVYFFILQQNKLQVRAVSLECLRILEFNINFAILYGCSFLPQQVLTILLDFYYRLHTLKAKFLVKRNYIPAV
ncbi:MAG: glycosyltransferase [Candidatus Omnitrophica bacterium]|nr:glycosyltransferase [Candidatus Omnitrophota bacterium]